MKEAFATNELDCLKKAFSEIKAETDTFLQNHFDNTFVHTDVYNDAQIEGKTLLVGRKGAGKTAILLGHQKINSSYYVGAKVITLDNMPFGALFNFFYSDYQKTIEKLSGKSEITDFVELEKVTCYAWKNAILGVSILAACEGIRNTETAWSKLTTEQQNKITIIKEEIESTVGSVKEDFKVNNSLVFVLLYFFLSLLQDAIEKSIGVDSPNLGAIVAKLLTDLLDKLDKDIEEKLSKSATELTAILTEVNKKIFIGVDKFDDYYDKFYEEIEYIRNSDDRKKRIKDRKLFLSALLEGLVLAARDLKQFKEFAWIDTLFAIPMDKFLELHLRERNDLEMRRTIFIQWTPRELFTFTAKRIKEALSMSADTSLENAWLEVMPATIHNGATSQPEDSFLYIARHSLWKPREIQMHIGHLIDEIQKNKGLPLTEDQIRASVRSSCREIVRQEFREEFSKEYPGLNGILNQLEHSKISSVMKYQDVCDTLKGEKLSDAITAVDDVMIRLYKMGVIGVRIVKHEAEHNEGATIAQNRAHICYKFHFNNREMNPFAPQSSIVVFHPMFIDVLGVEHNENYIINELKWAMWN